MTGQYTPICPACRSSDSATFYRSCAGCLARKEQIEAQSHRAATPPQRIQLSRAHGFNLQAASLALNGLPAIVVARPSPWGNPHRVWRDGGQWFVSSRGCEHHPVGDQAEGIALAVAKHAADCLKSAPFYGSATALLELRGKNLACWCKLGTPCHADTLLQLANRPGERVTESRRIAS